MKPFSRMLESVKGAINITGVVVDVALVVALIPIIKQFISDATNLSSSETLLLGLVTLIIVLALVFNIAKQSGLMKNK